MRTERLMAGPEVGSQLDFVRDVARRHTAETA